MDDRLIIANCSGFLGDRFTAAKEMVTGGPIDFLTGDYLAELTMAILFRLKSKDPDKGYAVPFLKQMEEVMGECLDRGIKIVSNAGGLNPQGLANALKNIAAELKLNPTIACIEGDNLLPHLKDLQEAGEAFTHLDKGTDLADSGMMPITANAYMGSWGIVKALDQGADIVVCGRVADAALVAGPAAWNFKWKNDDWDRMAGAVTAGHIIECGTQATGGNYSFFEEVPSFKNVGFPIAEIMQDGSFVITKHPNTGGAVTVDTVKAQLLYEIRGTDYLTPDVTVRFDTIKLAKEGEDRVRVEGVKGTPPPDTLKVCINTLGGYKNSMSVVLTGLDIEKKAAIVEDVLFDALGGKDSFKVADVRLLRQDKEDPQTNDEAFAYLKITLIDPDKDKVGRNFSSKVVELALSNIPGFTLTSPPAKAAPAIIHWPALVSSDKVIQTVYLDGSEYTIEPIKGGAFDPPKVIEADLPASPSGKMVRAALGRAFAARSGDKGGNANLGIWARTPEGFAFLREFLSTEKLKSLFTDLMEYDIERYELPNLFAVNFYIKGILGDGVAASLRPDGQAKTLGEYFRARVVEMPKSILIQEED